MPINPSLALLDAPLSDVVVLLLNQFRRLLGEGDVPLTSDQIKEIGAHAEQRDTDTATLTNLIQRMEAIIEESETELQTRFGFTFAHSLSREMDTIQGWETTAEFLEIANHKSNAELRISAGSALLLLLGNERFISHLWAVIDNDGGLMDVDAIIARRALCYHANVDPKNDQWQDQIVH